MHTNGSHKTTAREAEAAAEEGGAGNLNAMNRSSPLARIPAFVDPSMRQRTNATAPMAPAGEEETLGVTALAAAASTTTPARHQRSSGAAAPPSVLQSLGPTISASRGDADAGRAAGPAATGGSSRRRVAADVAASVDARASAARARGTPASDSRPAAAEADGRGGGDAAPEGGNSMFRVGRWTAAEHDLFVQGLQMYGKDWKRIATLVQSRSLVQIRTHAQKYFLKLAKSANADSRVVSLRGPHSLHAAAATAQAMGRLPSTVSDTGRTAHATSTAGAPPRSAGRQGVGSAEAAAPGGRKRRAAAAGAAAAAAAAAGSAPAAYGESADGAHSAESSARKRARYRAEGGEEPSPPNAAGGNAAPAGGRRTRAQRQRAGPAAVKQELPPAEQVEAGAGAKPGSDGGSQGEVVPAMGRAQGVQRARKQPAPPPKPIDPLVAATLAREATLSGGGLGGGAGGRGGWSAGQAGQGRGANEVDEEDDEEDEEEEEDEEDTAQLGQGPPDLDDVRRSPPAQGRRARASSEQRITPLSPPPARPPVSRGRSFSLAAHGAAAAVPGRFGVRPYVAAAQSPSAPPSGPAGSPPAGDDGATVLAAGAVKDEGPVGRLQRPTPLTISNPNSAAAAAAAAAATAPAEGRHGAGGGAPRRLWVPPPGGVTPASSTFLPSRLSRTALHQAVLEGRDALEATADKLAARARARTGGAGALSQLLGAAGPERDAAAAAAAAAAATEASSQGVQAEAWLHSSEPRGEGDSATGPGSWTHPLAKRAMPRALGTRRSSRRAHWADQADAHGYTALMTAAMVPQDGGAPACELLLDRGALPTAADKEGYTALHWAAFAGNAGVLKLLLAHGADVHASGRNGETALHRACRRAHLAAVEVLVDAGRADPWRRNQGAETPFFVIGTYDTEARRRERAVRDALLRRFPALRTLVLHHEECLEHRPGENGSQGQHPWESPLRLEAFLEALRAEGIVQSQEVAVSNVFDRVGMRALARVHSKSYLRFVHELSDAVRRTGQPVPFTPKVQRVRGTPDENLKSPDVSDTSFSRGSLHAAMRAAGSVCHAVDCVMARDYRNAFCAVRPPGHHAGVKGLLHNAVSCGFCIFNNVAIGALHALARHSDVVQRVAIVDIDAHHGNGTEEIVRRIARPSQLMFLSVHLYDKDPVGGYEFYPGSGGGDHVVHNVVNAPLAPLWRNPARARRAQPSVRRTRRSAAELGTSAGPSPAATGNGSSDAFGGGEGEDVPWDALPEAAGLGAGAAGKEGGRRSEAAAEYAMAGPSGRKPSEAFSHRPQVHCDHIGRFEFRRIITDRVMPALRAFNPDLILISAGFDGGRSDVGNARYEKGYGCGLDLLPQDFLWTTQMLQGVADMCCDGRLVSVLEGGYGHYNRQRGIERSSFARNAMAHLQGLVGHAALNSAANSALQRSPSAKPHTMRTRSRRTKRRRRGSAGPAAAGAAEGAAGADTAAWEEKCEEGGEGEEGEEEDNNEEEDEEEEGEEREEGEEEAEGEGEGGAGEDEEEEEEEGEGEGGAGEDEEEEEEEEGDRGDAAGGSPDVTGSRRQQRGEGTGSDGGGGTPPDRLVAAGVSPASRVVSSASPQ